MPRDDIPDIADKPDIADIPDIPDNDAPEPTARPRARRLGGVLAALVLVAAGGGLASATALTPQGPGSSRPIGLSAPITTV